MQEFADRPLRVAGEPYALHLLRLLRWAANLRLVPARREWRGGPLAAVRSFRLLELLTRSGQLLLWGAVMIALLGFRNRSGYPLFGGGVALALVAVALLAGQVLRPRVRVSRRVLGPATVGQPFRSEVTVQNLARTPLLDGSVRELRIPGVHVLLPGTAQQAALARLPGRGSATVAVDTVARRRGLLRLDGVAVQSHFPFYLTRATARCPAPAQVAVLPPAVRLAIPPLRGLAAQLAGSGTRRRLHDQGVEYHESRPFQMGDSPLRMDHRASARRGALLTRVHRGSEQFLPGGIALVLAADLPGYASWQRRPRSAAALDLRLGVAVELVLRARAEQLPIQALWLGQGWLAPGDEGALWAALAACPAQHALQLPAQAPAPELLCLFITGVPLPGDERIAAWAQDARASGRVVLHFVVSLQRTAPGSAPDAPGTYRVHA